MSQRVRYSGLVVLCTIGALIWWQSVRETCALAFTNDAYSHILIIIPMTVALLFLNHRKKRFDPKPSVLVGTFVLGLALLIGAIGWTFTGSSLRLTIQMLGFVIWLMGSFVVCFGVRVARGCAFPLLFLFWLVPMPTIVLDYVVQFLLHYTASLARLMFAIVGVPVRVQGTILSIPGLTVEVARECSSIRSSLILIVSSMVIAYVTLQSFWGRLVVICAAVFLAVAKNALRVFTLATLGAYVNPEILNGPLHRQGGVLFLAIALVVLAGLVWILCRAESKRLSSNLSGSALT